MKNFGFFCLAILITGLLIVISFTSPSNAQELQSLEECSDCQSNYRRAIVACIRFGGTYSNGQPAGWINVGDRYKCKSSQDSQCSGETNCTLSE